MARKHSDTEAYKYSDTEFANLVERAIDKAATMRRGDEYTQSGAVLKSSRIWDNTAVPSGVNPWSEVTIGHDRKSRRTWYGGHTELVEFTPDPNDPTKIKVFERERTVFSDSSKWVTRTATLRKLPNGNWRLEEGTQRKGSGEPTPTRLSRRGRTRLRERAGSYAALTLRNLR